MDSKCNNTISTIKALVILLHNLYLTVECDMAEIFQQANLFFTEIEASENKDWE